MRTEFDAELEDRLIRYAAIDTQAESLITVSCWQPFRGRLKGR